MESGLDDERSSARGARGERVDGSFISGARSLPLLYYYWRGWWVHGPTEL